MIQVLDLQIFAQMMVDIQKAKYDIERGGNNRKWENDKIC